MVFGIPYGPYNMFYIIGLMSYVTYKLYDIICGMSFYYFKISRRLIFYRYYCSVRLFSVVFLLFPSRLEFILYPHTTLNIILLCLYYYTVLSLLYLVIDFRLDSHLLSYPSGTSWRRSYIYIGILRSPSPS